MLCYMSGCLYPDLKTCRKPIRTPKGTVLGLCTNCFRSTEGLMSTGAVCSSGDMQVQDDVTQAVRLLV